MTATTEIADKILYIGVAFTAAIILIVMVLNYTYPSTHELAKTATFTVYEDGETTFAFNNQAQAISYSHSNSSTVIQQCIDFIASQQGGSIYLQIGDYSITNGLNISTSNISMTADPGTTFTGSVFPMLTLWYDTVDQVNEYDSLGHIVISDIEFYYTGIVQSGGAIYIHNVGTSHPLSVRMTNIIIRSSQTDIPEDTSFTGLRLVNVIGSKFESIVIEFFGTGFSHDTTLFSDPPEIYNDDGNSYFRFYFEYCFYGIWYKSTDGSGITVGEYWINPKMHYITEKGIYGTYQNAPSTIMIINPHFEAVGFGAENHTPIGIQLKSLYITISSGIFVGYVEMAPQIGIMVNGTGTAIIENCNFNNIDYPIQGFEQSHFVLTGNRYSGETEAVSQASWYIRANYDEYTSDNYGRNSATGAIDYITVSHGLTYWPTFIVVTSEQNGTGAVWISDRNSTTFRINFAIQPGASTWYFDWYATFSDNNYN